MLKQFAWIVLVFISVQLYSQVANNNMANRLELILDAEPILSNTANSTVEWNCIKKSLTQKCLVYHNDQWFQFTSPASGNYFLNLSSQACRDLRGIQLIVIEGNPCKTDSYKIIDCLPKIFQEDVFVKLDSLKANTLYLVNVDGFLGDFCEFKIQYASEPAGSPHNAVSLDTLQLKAYASNNIVSIQWHADQKLLETIHHFELYRKRDGEVKSKRINVASAKDNAYGNFVEDYLYHDTVSQEGQYVYKIIGITNFSDRILMDQTQIHFVPKPVMKIAEVPLSFAERGRVEIFVSDEVTRDVLNYFVHQYDVPVKLSINLQKYIEYGTRQFLIKARHPKTREVREFIFQVNESDEIVQLSDK